MGAQAQDFTWKNAISDYLSSIMLCKSLNSQVSLEKNHTAPATSAVWFLIDENEEDTLIVARFLILSNTVL